MYQPLKTADKKLLVDHQDVYKRQERLTDRDTGVVDVEGCLLFPGFIDAHTHFDLHVAGTVTADDFATGTKAAVRGGTTTIVDFGTQYTGAVSYTHLDVYKRQG